MKFGVLTKPEIVYKSIFLLNGGLDSPIPMIKITDEVDGSLTPPFDSIIYKMISSITDHFLAIQSMFCQQYQGFLLKYVPQYPLWYANADNQNL